MKKQLLFLTFGSLVSTSLSSIAAQYQEAEPAGTTEYTDVEYTPGAYRSYYRQGAPWFGSSHDRWGYHWRHADTPYRTGWHDKRHHRKWGRHGFNGRQHDWRHKSHRRHHGSHNHHSEHHSGHHRH